MSGEKTILGTRRVTASDVAREAKVSRVSVSRTFTEGAVVAHATRAKVLAAAEKLGYQPNALARSLKQRSSNLVALVAGYQENLYDARYLNLLLEALQSDGRYVLHAHVNEHSDVDAIIAHLLDYPLAAVVVAAGSIGQVSADKCVKLNAPIIMGGGASQSITGVDSVTCDNRRGLFMAVDHLLERGRRRLMCLTGPTTFLTSDERSSAFTECCKERNIEPLGIIETEFTFDGGYGAALDALRRKERPDALVCTNDAIATGALSAVRDGAGLWVPDDLAVIGFDDVLPAAWPCFELTTIRNPVNKRVTEISRLLKRRLEDRAAPFAKVVLEPELVVRKTT